MWIFLENLLKHKMPLVCYIRSVSVFIPLFLSHTHGLLTFQLVLITPKRKIKELGSLSKLLYKTHSFWSVNHQSIKSKGRNQNLIISSQKHHVLFICCFCSGPPPPPPSPLSSLRGTTLLCPMQLLWHCSRGIMLLLFPYIITPSTQ